MTVPGAAAPRQRGMPQSSVRTEGRDGTFMAVDVGSSAALPAPSDQPPRSRPSPLPGSAAEETGGAAPPLVLLPAEAAHLLRLDEDGRDADLAVRALDRLVAKRLLRPCIIAGRRRYSPAELLRFIEERTAAYGPLASVADPDEESA